MGKDIKSQIYIVFNMCFLPGGKRGEKRDGEIIAVFFSPLWAIIIKYRFHLTNSDGGKIISEEVLVCHITGMTKFKLSQVQWLGESDILIYFSHVEQKLWNLVGNPRSPSISIQKLKSPRRSNEEEELEIHYVLPPSPIIVAHSTHAISHTHKKNNV